MTIEQKLELLKYFQEQLEDNEEEYESIENDIADIQYYLEQINKIFSFHEGLK